MCTSARVVLAPSHCELTASENGRLACMISSVQPVCHQTPPAVHVNNAAIAHRQDAAAP